MNRGTCRLVTSDQWVAVPYNRTQWTPRKRPTLITANYLFPWMAAPLTSNHQITLLLEAWCTQARKEQIELIGSLIDSRGLLGLRFSRKFQVGGSLYDIYIYIQVGICATEIAIELSLWDLNNFSHYHSHNWPSPCTMPMSLLPIENFLIFFLLFHTINTNSHFQSLHTGRCCSKLI